MEYIAVDAHKRKPGGKASLRGTGGAVDVTRSTSLCRRMKFGSTMR